MGDGGGGEGSPMLLIFTKISIFLLKIINYIFIHFSVLKKNLN